MKFGINLQKIFRESRAAAWVCRYFEHQIDAPNIDIPAKSIEIDAPNIEILAKGIEIDAPGIDILAKGIEINALNIDILAKSIEINVLGTEILTRNGPGFLWLGLPAPLVAGGKYKEIVYAINVADAN